MSGPANRTGVTPACLSFLAIYNPSLSTSEETLHDQIVYYYSKADRIRTGRRSSSDVEAEKQKEEKNERLRQIGLAQGMVEFAKGFSDGEAVDSVETEKSKIILHELEPSWWILASIDLTRITSLSDRSNSDKKIPDVEYSGREVASAALLLQQVLRAYRTFLLHHASSLGEVYNRLTRSKFCTVLKRFWNNFVYHWDVLLNGNPALDLFNGLKLAAGGELGMGVGEEGWGSGEREVLEGFVDRTEGLVDMAVLRFGDAPEIVEPPSKATAIAAQRLSVDLSASWQADGQHPRPSDGVVFSGIGAITRSSIRDVTSWAEDLFRYGQEAYGVRDNPSSIRWRRRGEAKVNASISQESQRSGYQQPSRRRSSDTGSALNSSRKSPTRPGIPQSIVGINRRTSQATPLKPSLKATVPREISPDNAHCSAAETETGTETMMKYLTLGVYGSKWGIPFKKAPENPQVSKIREDGKARSNSPGKSVRSYSSKLTDEMPGYFLIGFRGDLESSVEDDEYDEETGEERADRISDENQSSRTMVRTLYVSRLEKKGLEASNSSEADETERVPFPESFSDRLRVVVYVHQPFMFVCLFELQTDTLAIPAFYRSIHHQLGPLQRPLLTSTEPDKVSARLWEASLPKSTASTQSSQPIGDLVYDPTRLTIHTTIPNIPVPGTSTLESLGADTAPWSRVEALNVYSQIMSIYESTRRRGSELERTCKTSRGWWVVWMRLPDSTQPTNPEFFREAFLIRKASDYTAPNARKTGARFGRDVSGSSSSWGPGKLVEGIGIDSRQYIEGLLTLNR